MPQAKPAIRLYVPEPFTPAQSIRLSQPQSHYLAHVMRLNVGDAIAVFNGQNGEWRAELTAIEKKSVTLILRQCITPFIAPPDLWLAFAPIRNKTDLVVEKAVELGVCALLPVVTRHAVVRSLNMEKLAAHAVEAAEQCGRHDVPRIEAHDDLASLLGGWPGDRILLHADESGSGAALKTLLPTLPKGKYALLIGPEGGFAADERQMLAASPHVQAVSLGPRILRADTAAVAALACVQAWLGDWERAAA